MLLLLVAGCASLDREQRPELSCSGPITEESMRADLVAAFGIENVRDEEIDIGEGETVEGTVIYPDDASRRVEVVWKDEKRKIRVTSVRVTDPSDWVVQGLTTGLDLLTVETLNGRPFSLYGFEWDYAGTIASWNGGAFDLGGPCRILARFSPPGGGTNGDLAGEEVFGSDDPRMRGVDPVIYELLLLFD